mgnify:CR=1 FL=1
MLVTWKAYKERQNRILVEIINGNCTLSCAAAIHVDGSCHCRCGGFNHGAIWIEDIIVEHILDEG